MARKKSVGGRARSKSDVQILSMRINKINRRLQQLQYGKNLNFYKGKELLNFVARNRAVKLVKSKKSGRLRVELSDYRTYKDMKEANKKFIEFMRSKVFSNIGIARVRQETRTKLLQTLKESSGRKGLTMEAVDKFIELAVNVNQAKKDSLLDKIDPSDFQRLIFEAQDHKYSVTTWIDELASIANIQDINDLDDIRNLTLRKEAIDLYNQYVR